MTENQFERARNIAHILKTDPDVAREIVNSFEDPQYLLHALGFSSPLERRNKIVVPTLSNNRVR